MHCAKLSAGTHSNQEPPTTCDAAISRCTWCTRYRKCHHYFHFVIEQSNNAPSITPTSPKGSSSRSQLKLGPSSSAAWAFYGVNNRPKAHATMAIPLDIVDRRGTKRTRDAATTSSASGTIVNAWKRMEEVISFIIFYLQFFLSSSHLVHCV